MHRIALWLATVFAGLALAGTLWHTGLIDTVPPTILIEPPEGDALFCGDVNLRIEAEDVSPGRGTVTLQIDAQSPSVVTSPDVVLSTLNLPDGQHKLTVHATDRSWRQNSSQSSFVFESDNTPPALMLDQQSLQGTQGETLSIKLSTNEPLSHIAVDVLGKERTLYEMADGHWRALVGVGVDQEVGLQAMTITATDLCGNAFAATAHIDIRSGDYPSGGRIALTQAQRAARRDVEAVEESRRQRLDAYQVRTDQALWNAPMIAPVAGRRTSPFGRYRTYSDGQRSHHLGMDIAAPTGTPVGAAAPGIVRLAGWQHIYGNVVILEHGQGVATSYNHLSSIAVEVGGFLEQGDILGTVGSTGQSTGPHLHWGAVVDGVAVNPEQWLGDGFVTATAWVPVPPPSEAQHGQRHQ